jgi:hypothetical protein
MGDKLCQFQKGACQLRSRSSWKRVQSDETVSNQQRGIVWATSMSKVARMRGGGKKGRGKLGFACTAGGNG